MGARGTPLSSSAAVMTGAVKLVGEADGGVEVVGGFGNGFAGEGVVAGVDLEGDGVAVSAKAGEVKATKDRRRGRIFFISQRIGRG